jgi:hypothetical protein
MRRAVLDCKIVEERRTGSSRASALLSWGHMARAWSGSFQSRPRYWKWYRYVTRSDGEPCMARFFRYQLTLARYCVTAVKRCAHTKLTQSAHDTACSVGSKGKTCRTSGPLKARLSSPFPTRKKSIIKSSFSMRAVTIKLDRTRRHRRFIEAFTHTKS